MADLFGHGPMGTQSIQMPVIPGAFLRAVARQEGFGIPGAVPTTHNNPGDLRHSPHSEHTPDAPDAIGQIDTVQHGWQDLARQWFRYCQGQPNITVADAIRIYCPPDVDGNNTEQYIDNVCAWTPCKPFQSLYSALAIP